MVFLGVFWYQFKTFIWKKYSKSKQTKYLGFIKSGVQWAEQDIKQLKVLQSAKQNLKIQI